MFDPVLSFKLAELVIEAGNAILDLRADWSRAIDKSDGSPVTAADLMADEIIAEGLGLLLPGIPVISEETAADVPAGFNPDGIFALVDPLDGTGEFVAGAPEFTVNLALVSGRTPVFGVIYAPVLGELYLAHRGAFATRLRPGQGFSRESLRPIQCRPTARPPLAMTSRRFQSVASDAFIDQIRARREATGSSLKFCRVAEGRADVYPRLGPSMEWDTAAGHALLAFAGGWVETDAAMQLHYGKHADGFRNPGFVACGDRLLLGVAA